MKKKILIIALTLITSNIFSQITLRTIEDISEYGTKSSIDYKNSLLELDEVEDDLESIITLDETKIEADIEYDNDSSTNPDLELSLDIPISDQLSVSWSIDEDSGKDLKFSLDPINVSETKKQNELSYKKAIINSEIALLDAEYNAIKYALNWMVSKQDYELQKRNWGLEQTIYNDDKNRYEEGDITLDDLKDSLIEWSEARKEYITSEQELRESEKDLYSALGSTKQDVEVSLLSIDSLTDSLTDLKNSMELDKIKFLNSSEWRLSSISVDSAKEHYDKTWVYEPDFSVSFSIPYDEGFQPNEYSISLSYEVSLDDFNKSERDRAKEYYDIAVLENRLKLNEAEVNLDQSKKLLESNGISSDIFRIEYEQAQLLYEESKLLYSRGEYSEIELEESDVYLSSSQKNLFEALVSEYLSWLDLKQYF